MTPHAWKRRRPLSDLQRGGGAVSCRIHPNRETADSMDSLNINNTSNNSAPGPQSRKQNRPTRHDRTKHWQPQPHTTCGPQP